MVEITIKKIKAKKKAILLDFIKSKTTQVCFTSFHGYHLTEEEGEFLIDEYKERCRNRLHELREAYKKNLPSIVALMKKEKLNSEDDLYEYSEDIFNSEMSLVKQISETIELIKKEEKTMDYQDLFPTIKQYYVSKEVHMYDSISLSIIPYDYVVYKVNDTIFDILKEFKTLENFIVSDIDDKYALFNPMFCNDNEAFAIISSEFEYLSMQLSNENYNEFLKLKIKHEMEVIDNETN